MDGLPYYRVRMGRRIIQCELEELLELATQARIHTATLIIPPFSESWQAADALIELSGRLSKPPHTPEAAAPTARPRTAADPWAAWDSMAEDGAPAEDGEEAWEEELATDVGMTPIQPAPTPLAPPPAPRHPEPELLPAASIVPLDAEPAGAPTTPRAPTAPPPAAGGGAPVRPVVAGGSRGKVIAFPRERSRRDVEGAYALAPEEFPVFRPPPPKPPASSPTVESLRYSIHWSRLIALTGAGLAVLAAVWFYVRDTASTTFPPHPGSISRTVAPGPGPGPAPSVAGGTPVPGVPPAAVATGGGAGDPYHALETELRSRMSIELLDVNEPGDLTDAMYIELARVKVDVKTARAEVIAWSGRKQDEPDVAEFLIQVRSAPDHIDRDLGGVALIVGKYIQRYNLKAPQLDVYLENPDGHTSRWSLDPELTRNFYIQRITLTQLLSQTLEGGRTPTP